MLSSRGLGTSSRNHVVATASSPCEPCLRPSLYSFSPMRARPLNVAFIRISDMLNETSDVVATALSPCEPGKTRLGFLGMGILGETSRICIHLIMRVIDDMDS